MSSTQASPERPLLTAGSPSIGLCDLMALVCVLASELAGATSRALLHSVTAARNLPLLLASWEWHLHYSSECVSRGLCPVPWRTVGGQSCRGERLHRRSAWLVASLTPTSPRRCDTPSQQGPLCPDWVEERQNLFLPWTVLAWP